MKQEDINDLIIKIHENTKDLPSRFDEHEKWDNKRFLWGLIAILVLAASSGVLNQVLSITKIGM